MARIGSRVEGSNQGRGEKQCLTYDEFFTIFRINNILNIFVSSSEDRLPSIDLGSKWQLLE